MGKYDIGEADRSYVIYTLEEGKIRARALGARKPSARLAAALENFNLADICVMKKSGIGNIASAIVEKNFSNFKSDLDRVIRVFRQVKIFEKMVGEGVKEQRLFFLLGDYLQSMNDFSSSDSLKKNILDQGFIYKLLAFSGYEFEVFKCAACGAKLTAGKNYFSARQGGVICVRCAPAENGCLSVSSNAIKIMRLFFVNKLKSLVKIKAEKKDLAELERLSQAFLQWIGK